MSTDVKAQLCNDLGSDWVMVGEHKTLSKKPCQRLYARKGKKHDLSLMCVRDKVYALEAWCSHMGGPLFEGDIEDYKGSPHVMCPWHGYMFDVQTGVEPYMGLQQEKYEVKVINGKIFIKYHSELSVLPYDEENRAATSQ